MGKLREAAEKYIAWHDGDNAEALLQVVDEVENSMRWIPVVERLPEAGKEVLVQLQGGGIYTAWYGSNNKIWRSSDSLRECCHVVAWMSLPKPYEAENYDFRRVDDMAIARFIATQCDTRFERPMQVVSGCGSIGIAVNISYETDQEITLEYLLRMAKEIESLPPVNYKHFKNVKPIY